MLFLELRQFRFARSEGAQLLGSVDQFIGDDVNDQTFALDLAAYFQELGDHDRAPVLGEYLRPDHLFWRETEAAARKLGVELQPLEVRGSDDLEAVFAA